MKSIVLTRLSLSDDVFEDDRSMFVKYGDSCTHLKNIPDRPKSHRSSIFQGTTGDQIEV